MSQDIMANREDKARISFNAKFHKNWKNFQLNFLRHWQLYIIILPPFIWLIIFRYVPMYGIQLAFRKYNALSGLTGGELVGLRYFRQFFNSPSAVRYILNTFALSVYSTVAGFLPPLVLAICLNEARGKYFKKAVQMITYAPYFISTVILVGIIIQFTGLRNGIANQILGIIGISPINFMGKSSMFRSIYVWTGIWQTTGYNCIIYLAALTGVNPELQEAAIIDGASRVKRIWHVDLPAIRTTIITLFILGVGFTMSIGFEKVYLMQNDINIRTAEIISTYIYKIGLQQNNYSMSTAVGLFNSVVNLFLLLIVNFTSKKLTDTGIW
jgi:ABC-type polysaccharide transport system permease subunit